MNTVGKNNFLLFITVFTAQQQPISLHSVYAHTANFQGNLLSPLAQASETLPRGLRDLPGWSRQCVHSFHLTERYALPDRPGDSPYRTVQQQRSKARTSARKGPRLAGDEP
jgi:hypothetical protein